MPDKIYIPKRDSDETECPLPDIYQKACKKIMHPDGWSCEGKCWRKILAAMVRLGKYTFVVDPSVKEFNYSTLTAKPEPKPEQKSKPKTKPKKDLFGNW